MFEIFAQVSANIFLQSRNLALSGFKTITSEEDELTTNEDLLDAAADDSMMNTEEETAEDQRPVVSFHIVV